MLGGKQRFSKVGQALEYSKRSQNIECLAAIIVQESAYLGQADSRQIQKPNPSDQKRVSIKCDWGETW